MFFTHTQKNKNSAPHILASSLHTTVQSISVGVGPVSRDIVNIPRATKIHLIGSPRWAQQRQRCAQWHKASLLFWLFHLVHYWWFALPKLWLSLSVSAPTCQRNSTCSVPLIDVTHGSMEFIFTSMYTFFFFPLIPTSTPTSHSTISFSTDCGRVYCKKRALPPSLPLRFVACCGSFERSTSKALNFLDFEITNLPKIWEETSPGPSPSSAHQWQWQLTYNLLLTHGKAAERKSHSCMLIMGDVGQKGCVCLPVCSLFPFPFSVHD